MSEAILFLIIPFPLRVERVVAVYFTRDRQWDEAGGWGSGWGGGREGRITLWPTASRKNSVLGWFSQRILPLNDVGLLIS